MRRVEESIRIFVRVADPKFRQDSEALAPPETLEFPAASPPAVPPMATETGSGAVVGPVRLMVNVPLVLVPMTAGEAVVVIDTVGRTGAT